MTQLALPRLFLVEDTSDDEAMSLRGISKSGVACDVTVGRDGAEALEILLGSGTAVPELIVLDFRLPKMNGLEVLRVLRKAERTRVVPIVILSGTNSSAELKECYLSGANSCVEKPSDTDLYIERVGLIVKYWLTVNQEPHRDA
jgi:two-component system response regulator